MPATGLPSSRRPLLSESAPGLTGAVEEMVGDTIRGEQPAAAGFTVSVASTLHLARGEKVFIKAGEAGTAAGRAVTTGAELAPVIGDLGPQLRSHRIVEGWSVAIYDHIPGAAIEQWDDSAVRAMQGLSLRLRERLDPAPVDRTVPYAQAFLPLLGCWRALADPRHPERSSVQHLADLDLPDGLEAARLADLEADWLRHLEPGQALQHGDLRADNVVREPRGRLWLVDWTHRWTGPGWADLVRLAPDLVAHGGHDADAFLAGSAWGDAPRDGVDVMIAGLAGRAWRDGHRPEVPDLPGLRRMQREQAHAILTWLARRLGRP